MLLTIIDNEVVAKKCGHTFMKLNFTFRETGKNFKEFAESIDDDSLTPTEQKVYNRLRREFKKKTGIEVRLTANFSQVSKKQHSWTKPTNTFSDVDGFGLPDENYQKPLWITEVKLAPALRKIKAKLAVF